MVTEEPDEFNSDEDGRSSHPQNESGYYPCYRKCEDETPCQRIIFAPQSACYQHFGQPQMDADGENK